MSMRGKMPAAPPVYRPQPVPRVLQSKFPSARQPSPQAKPAPAPHAKPSPVAQPVYRPQPTPRALQPKAATMKAATKHPTPAPVRPPAKPAGPVAPPVYRPQQPPIVAQRKTAGPPAPATGRAFKAPTAPAPVQRSAPNALQPKTPPGRTPPPPSAASRSQAIIPLRQAGNFPGAARSGGVVQLEKRTKSKATVTTGTIKKPIPLNKKFSSKKDTIGRVINVRGLVRQGNKRKRKATTKGKKGGKFSTTETSLPLNDFLKAAGLYSVLTRFEGSHAIADVFGGPTSRTNTFPLPHAFNTICYKKAETELKKTLDTQNDTTMEVSIQYPEDSLEGFLTSGEKKKLVKKVGSDKVEKLEDLFSSVPGWMSWEVNDKSGQGHEWTDFDNIRKDLWPTGTKPDDIFTKQFINAVNNL